MAADDDKETKSLEAAAGKPAKQAKPAPTPPRPPSLARSLTPAGRPQAAKQAAVVDAIEGPTCLKFAFLGAGQGGGRVADAFWKLGYRRVAAFNTTDSDFGGLDPAVPRLSLHVGGARKDAQLAAQQLAGREEEVRDLMTRAWGPDLDHAFVCAGLGGGTGSGTGPKLVELARKQMEAAGVAPRVGVIVSLPHTSEGQQSARNALGALKQLMAMKASPIVIIDNTKVKRLYKPSISSLFATANQVVSTLLHVFNAHANVRREARFSFDESEFRQLLDGGIATMSAVGLNVAEIQSPADVTTAIREQLAGNALVDADVRTGHAAACVMLAPQSFLDNFDDDYVEGAWAQLDRLLGSARKKDDKPKVIHRGLYAHEDAAAETLDVYTMISGLEPPVARLAELAKEAGIGDGGGDHRKGVAHFLGVE